MDESRVLRKLNRVDDLGEPDPTFLDRLYGDALAEIGLAGSTRPATHRLGPSRPRFRLLGGGKRTRWPLLLVAAVLVGSALAVLGVGALRDKAVTEQVDLLARVHSLGSITIAVRPDQPQFTVAGQVAAGFDVDVGNEIARRLGVSANIAVVEAGGMLSPPDSSRWDVALPSVPSWTITPAAFVSSSPYYYWPHLVVVPERSTATSVADLGSGSICVVARDAGEAWLRGDYNGLPAPTTRATAVSRSSDDECLAMLASGQAVAAVTANLTTGDVTTRGGLRTIESPTAEPRVIVIGSGVEGRPDPASLLTALENALDEMRRDGTLARMSENRFGVDLTNP
jgi:cystine transport system substrate-binding protein